MIHRVRFCALALVLGFTSPIWAQEAPPTAPEPSANELPAAPPSDPPPYPQVVEVPPPSPPTPPAIAEGDASAHLEEVVVTATKRSRNLREIPSSITSLSGADLEQRGIQGVEDLARLVPGLNVADNGVSATRVTIRGVASDQFTSATTGVLFGDVSFADVYYPLVALDPNPFDLKSVEVLKGPQGTLFGASALNGAVRYVPQNPELGRWATRIFAQGNTVSEGERGGSAGGALNVPVGDSAAARLVGFYRRIPGVIDNDSANVMEADSNRGTQIGARALFDWKPDGWDIGLIYALQRTRFHDLDTADNTDGDLSATNRPALGVLRTAYELGNLKLRYLFEDWGGEIVSDTSYVEKDAYKNLCNSSTAQVHDSPVCFLRIVYDARSTTYSQEFRLVSPTGDSPWRYIAGIAGFQQHIISSQRAPFGAPQGQLGLLDGVLPDVLTALIPAQGGTVSLQDLDLDVTAKELAGFGEVTRKLGPFEVTLGGRYYVTTSGGLSVVSGPLTQAVALNRQPTIDETITERGFNPKASVVFHATRDLMAYITVARGFRVGGVQPGSPFAPAASMRQVPTVFKSDTIWSYEGGVRTAWLHNTLQVDTTLYYLKWKDPQLLQPDGAGIGNYLDNVGGAKGKGVEAAIRYLTPFGLHISLAGSYSKTRTTVPFEASSGNTVPVGAPWPMAPDWQTASTLSYPMTLGSWSLAPGVTHTYISQALFDLNTQYPVLGYQQWDAMVSLSNPSIRWWPDISLSASNLADKRALTGFVGRTEENNSAAGTYTRYIQPRTILLRLSKDF